VNIKADRVHGRRIKGGGERGKKRKKKKKRTITSSNHLGDNPCTTGGKKKERKSPIHLRGERGKKREERKKKTSFHKFLYSFLFPCVCLLHQRHRDETIREERREKGEGGERERITFLLSSLPFCNFANFFPSLAKEGEKKRNLRHRFLMGKERGRGKGRKGSVSPYTSPS